MVLPTKIYKGCFRAHIPMSHVSSDTNRKPYHGVLTALVDTWPWEALKVFWSWAEVGPSYIIIYLYSYSKYNITSTYYLYYLHCMDTSFSHHETWAITLFSLFQLFDEYLPLSEKSQIQTAEQAGADNAYERKAAAQLKLWKYVSHCY